RTAEVSPSTTPTFRCRARAAGICPTSTLCTYTTLFRAPTRGSREVGRDDHRTIGSAHPLARDQHGYGRPPDELADRVPEHRRRERPVAGYPGDDQPGAFLLCGLEHHVRRPPRPDPDRDLDAPGPVEIGEQPFVGAPLGVGRP